MAQTPNNFGILIRHNGFIDSYVRTQPHPYYPADNLNAYPTSDPDQVWRFKTHGEADAKARELADRFGTEVDGSSKYRFDVIEYRMVPRWFLVKPTREREKGAVGSTEQLG